MQRHDIMGLLHKTSASVSYAGMTRGQVAETDWRLLAPEEEMDNYLHSVRLITDFAVLGGTPLLQRFSQWLSVSIVAVGLLIVMGYTQSRQADL